MSVTSNASLSSGQIVGPLWTWMFLIPSSTHLSRNGTASGSVSFQPREPSRHSAVQDQLALEPLHGLGVLLDRVEALRVPLLQVRRLQQGHVDVAVDEHVLLEVVQRVLLEVLERPMRLRRAKPHIGVEALDPALRVLLGAGLPVL